MLDKTKTLKIVGYIFIAILIAILIKAVDFNDLIQHIAKARIEILFLLLALQIITQLIISFQWHNITKCVLGESSFIKILNMFTRGTVVEAITPGAKIGGEVTRLYYLKKDFNTDTDKALSIIIIQKSVSMSVLFSICAISFFYICTKIKYALIVQIFASIINFMLISFMIGLLFFSEKLYDFLSKFENKIVKKINNFIKSYVSSTKKLSKNEWIKEFILSIIIWILYPLKMFILANSFGIKMPFLIILAITMTSYFLAMFPITPGGIGTFEGSMVGFFAIMDINTTLAVTISVVFRFVTFWFVILISGIYTIIYDFIIKRRGKSA